MTIQQNLPQQVLDQKGQLTTYVKGLWIDTDKIKDETLLMQAFVHKSFAADFKTIWLHNERLEFLWDWVLWAAICKFLFIDHPEMAESDMTLYKIALVREETLADVARNIGLWQQVLISKWEEKMQWRKKDSILSDALEALIWYISVDLGYSAAESFIKKHVYSMFDSVDKNPVQSYKTMAQELTQKQYKQIPEYVDSEYESDGKWNVSVYKSEFIVLWQKKSEGFGQNKKKAQEDAAKNFYNGIA